MYLDHFGLTVNPFGLSPKINFVFESGAFEENMAHLVYGLENSEAITLISGPVGSGKTLAIQTFLMKLGSQFSFALVTNTQVTSIELLKLILEDLDIKTPIGCDKSDLLILFKDFLLQEHNDGRRVVIVIDEAQNLEPDALEEVRLLTNLGQGDFQPVQIVLVGQPELEALVDQPSLRQLRQRIRVHYRLTPLLVSEVEGYLNHRMQVAGCSRSVFSSEAVLRIFQLSGGIPRLTNSLANAALLSAYVAGRDSVKSEDVDPGEAGMPDPQLKEFSPKEEPIKHPQVGENLPQNPTPIINTPISGDQKTDEQYDYAQRKKKTNVTWILLLVVFLIALSVGGLYMLGYLPQSFNNMEQSSDISLETTETLIPVDVVSLEVKEVQAHKDTSSTLIAPPKEIIPVPVPQKFWAHIASFQRKSDADEYLSVLEGQNFSVAVQEKFLGKKVWFRVCLGPFGTEDAANRTALQMQLKNDVEYFQIFENDELPAY